MEGQKLVHKGEERGQGVGVGVQIPPLEPLENLGR